MGWFDWFPSNPIPDWSAISMDIFIGIIAVIMLLMGGALMVKGTKGPVILGIILFIGGGTALAWALGLI